MSKLLRARWDKGERDFSLLNEGRTNLELAMQTYKELTVAAEEANDVRPPLLSISTSILLSIPAYL